MPARDSAAVLALDVGTSSCRASLYDLSGRPIRSHAVRQAYSPTTTADGGAEYDPRTLLEHVCRAIDEILASAGTRPIVAVGTDTFWHSLVGLDARGNPLTPLYLWLDARSRAEAAALRDELDEQSIHARTGCKLHWSYWPAKLRWLRCCSPDVFQSVSRWVSFGEFLLEQLAGQTGISVSMASGTGLLDAHRCDWDAELLEVCRIRRDQLGQLTPLSSTTTTAATFVERWPALRDVPWIAATGDGACSNIGADCTTPDRFALMIGTSGAERVVLSPAGHFTIPDGVWCYRLDAQRAVLGGALNDGGSLFEWLRTSLRLPPVARAEAAIASMEPDAHGLTVLPFWGGERSPGWADDARGAIVGARLHTTPLDILRACMEAVALRFGEVDRELVEVTRSTGAVIATGGALLRSPAWMQMLSDVLGRPVLASSEREASSRGASLLALEALGRLPRPLDTFKPRIGQRFEPIVEHTERYRAAADRQRRLYDALVR